MFEALLFISAPLYPSREHIGALIPCRPFENGRDHGTVMPWRRQVYAYHDEREECLAALTGRSREPLC